jgi:hypothetical protein
MTLENRLLEKLSEWRPESARSTLTVTGGAGQTVVLTADRNDDIATRLWEMTLTRGQPVADLKGWAERISERVTGLLEPLKLVEVDSERGVAQLRSESPANRDETLGYYEVLLHSRGEANVRRYQAAANGSKRREQVGFALTHEVLAKLVNDLIQSV